MSDNKKPYDSADEKQVAAAKRVQHNDKQTEVNDLRATMNTVNGRRFMWRLLARCAINQGGYNPDNSYVQFRNGMRDIGLYYLDMITTHCNEAYILMLKEHNDSNKKRGN